MQKAKVMTLGAQFIIGGHSARGVLALAAFFLFTFSFFLPAATPPDDDPDIEMAGRLERAFQKLAKRVAPCVVSLEVIVKPGSWAEELRRMSEQPHGLPFDRKFEGSGVIVDPAGLIITNEHVVHRSSQIRVKLADGRSFAAEVCGRDPRSDLAMIKLTGENVPPNLAAAELADSDKVAVGQWALAVGNPFGLSNTLTVGVVSGRGRSMPVHHLSNDVFYGNLLQTDAAINPGNSGGPLFDLRGKLIGINTMIFSQKGISEGFGFAIPSNHLQKRLEYLKAGREVEYGWLGVRPWDFEPGQTVFSVPEDKGVLLKYVIPDTPADRAGLEAGMVVLDIDGQRVASAHELICVVNDIPVGRTVKVKALDRAGKSAEFSVRISKRSLEIVRASVPGLEPGIAEAPVDLDDDTPAKESKPVPATKTASGGADRTVNSFAWRGMQVKELSAEDARKRGGRLEIVRVKKGSSADRAGLYEGAVITELKHGGNPAIQKFGSLEEFKRVTSAVTGAAALHLPLDGYVTVEDK